MEKLVIQGGAALKGEVRISGAKNAALPVLFASLLHEGESRIANLPRLQDIRTTLALLMELGVGIQKQDDGSRSLDASRLLSNEAPYDLVRKMRASVLCLGPLLARFGEARVSLPGGCAIGARPIDLHLRGLEALGASIELEAGYVQAKAPKGG